MTPPDRCTRLKRLLWGSTGIERVRAELGGFGAVVVASFPANSRALVDFGIGTGSPMVKAAFRRDVAEHPVSSPLLWIGTDGRSRWRYWQGIVDGIRELASQRAVDPSVFGAIAEFNKAVRAEENILGIGLNAGDPLLVDNERVGHGRSGFCSLRTRDDGSTTASPRRLLRPHVASSTTWS